eukprot:jgi/Hompol1/2445/HPOL_006003-RA
MHSSMHSSIYAASGPRRRSVLTCTGHTRPVVDVAMSAITASGNYFILSASSQRYNSPPLCCVCTIRSKRLQADNNNATDSAAMLMDNNGATIGMLKGHKGAVWACRLTRDASLSITGSADFSAKLWNNATGTELLTLSASHVVRAVDVSDDNRFLMTGGFEKILRIYDSAVGGSKPVRELSGFRSEIKHAVMDSDRGLVFNADGTELQVWDLRTCLQLPSIYFERPLSSVRLSIDRQSLVCTSGTFVFLFNLDSSEQQLVLSSSSQTSAASINPARDMIAVASSSEPWIRLFDTQTGYEQEILKGHHGSVHSLEFSPDGKSLASGSEDGTVRIWSF